MRFPCVLLQRRRCLGVPQGRTAKACALQEEQLMAWWAVLQLSGLALCVVGVAIIFLFGYPPKEEEGQVLFTRLSRLALLVVFLGFLLQFAAAVAEALR
jgi:hypothetical protein